MKSMGTKSTKTISAKTRKAIPLMLGTVLLIILAAGCQLSGESAEAAEPAAESAAEQGVSNAANGETDTDQTISLEVIEQWARKGSALTVRDFEPYIEFDMDALRGGSEEGEIPFVYENTPYYLRVTAEGEADAASLDECRLVSAVLFPEEFLRLRSWEDEYEFDGACADIRSGNLEHILDGEIRMTDYLICELPADAVCSGFKHWLGTRGGAAFINAETGEGELTIENAGFYAVKQEESPIQGGMEIFGAGEIEQSVSVLEAYPELELDDNVVISRTQVQVDDGYTWYLARVHQEGASIEYCLYLDAEKYTLEEFEEMTGTVRLRENAFY